MADIGGFGGCVDILACDKIRPVASQQQSQVNCSDTLTMMKNTMRMYDSVDYRHVDEGDTRLIVLRHTEKDEHTYIWPCCVVN
eukprot:scaffold660584_cov71-Prasinocladus_malaysianus.AAC.1